MNCREMKLLLIFVITNRIYDVLLPVSLSKGTFLLQYMQKIFLFYVLEFCSWRVIPRVIWPVVPFVFCPDQPSTTLWRRRWTPSPTFSTSPRNPLRIPPTSTSMLWGTPWSPWRKAWAVELYWLSSTYEKPFLITNIYTWSEICANKTRGHPLVLLLVSVMASFNEWRYLDSLVISRFLKSSSFPPQQLYRKRPGMTMQCAKLPQNVSKNRYRDISPCTWAHMAARSVLPVSADNVTADSTFTTLCSCL